MDYYNALVEECEEIWQKQMKECDDVGHKHRKVITLDYGHLSTVVVCDACLQKARLAHNKKVKELRERFGLPPSEMLNKWIELQEAETGAML